MVPLGLPSRCKYLHKLKVTDKAKRAVVCLPHGNMSTFFAWTRKAIEDAPNGRVDEAFEENNAAKVVQMVDGILPDWMKHQARGENTGGEFLVMIDRRYGWEALIQLLQKCV